MKWNDAILIITFAFVLGHLKMNVGFPLHVKIIKAWHSLRQEHIFILFYIFVRFCIQRMLLLTCNKWLFHILYCGIIYVKLKEWDIEQGWNTFKRVSDNFYKASLIIVNFISVLKKTHKKKPKMDWPGEWKETQQGQGKPTVHFLHGPINMIKIAKRWDIHVSLFLNIFKSKAEVVKFFWFLVTFPDNKYPIFDATAVGPIPLITWSCTISQ